MEDKHRAIIRSNLVRFGKDLQVELDLVNYFVQFKILTDNDRETLVAKTTRADKANWLMMNIDKKGPFAFEIFFRGLMDTNQAPLADLLKPELAAERQQREKEEMEAMLKQQVPKQESIIAQPTQPLDTKPPHYSQEALDEPDLTDDLPQTWPILDRSPFDINITPVTNNNMKKIHADKKYAEYYKMNSKPYKGRAVLINNKEFKVNGIVDNSLTRHGTEIDGMTMTQFLDELKYYVVQHHDKTEKEMKDILDKESQNPDHSVYDSFILVIMSHGTKNDCVYGVDHPNTVDLAYIRKQFDGEHCPALAGKPKMFFIQACKGDERDKGRVYAADCVDSSDGGNIVMSPANDSPDGVEAVTAGVAEERDKGGVKQAQGVDSTLGGNIVTSPADDSHEGVEAVTVGVAGLRVTAADTTAERPGDHVIPVTKGDSKTKRAGAPIPRDADMIIVSATTPEMVAYRETGEDPKGSWFLQAVIYVFMTLAHKKHLSELLRKVIALVSRSENTDGFKQVPSVTSTLRKDLYFYPGLEED